MVAFPSVGSAFTGCNYRPSILPATPSYQYGLRGSVAGVVKKHRWDAKILLNIFVVIDQKLD